MAVNIDNDLEVWLDSRKYTLRNRIAPQYIPRLTSKVNTGADSFDREQFLSNYTISDNRGGILVDEMDESVQDDTCWWTNCIIKHDGHLTLPRLATKISPPTAIAPTIVNGTMEANSDWTGGAQSSTQKRTGTYSWKVTATALGNYDAYQTIQTGWAPGVAYTATVYGYLVNPGANEGHLHIWLDDGVTPVESAAMSTEDSFTAITCTITPAATATRLTLYLRATMTNDNSYDTSGYFDDATITNTGGTLTVGTIGLFENFNSELYATYGKLLTKLNSGRTKFDLVRGFPATITALTSSLSSNLYVYQGDSTNYFYMNTSEVFNQNDTSAAYWGIQAAANLWKLSTSGTFSKSSNPNNASPTWSNEGDISDNVSEIEGLFLGRDTSGTTVIYAATNSILKVYDDTNNVWLDTEVRLPAHPIGGKGATYWSDGHYLSYGLGVLKYVTGSNTATLTEVGLNRHGGLPAEFNGEIVKFCPDSNYELFALVDSSVTSGNSRSGLYAYDGRGWSCWWTPASTIIDDCEDVWDEFTCTNVVASLDATDFKVGSGSVKFVIAAGFGTGIVGTEVITSTDLSGHTHASVWVKSSIALDAGDIQLLLDDTAECDSAIETIDFPALTADTWTRCVLTLAAASSDTAIISVGINIAVNKAAFTLNIDQIEGQNYNEAMHDVIVSSAESAYAVYWDCGGYIYYIDLPRGLQNPKQLKGTQKYESKGIFLSPWFDAGTSAYKKLAKRITTFARDITTTETVAIKHRDDQEDIDLDGGWTTLDTLNTTAEAGENEELFASGAGVAFNTKQIRLDLARGTTNTLTPDLQALTMAYELLSKGNESWVATLVMDDEHNSSARDKDGWIQSALDSDTHVPFIFRKDDTNETHYVRVFQGPAWTQTGEQFQGEYTLKLVEM